jgi:multidrug efflux pump subunit AcrB
MQAVDAKDFSKYDMLYTSIPTTKNEFKINDFSTMNLVKTSNGNHKEDRQYIRIVGFEYFGSYKFGDRYLTKILDELKIEMPEGFSAEKKTFSWSWEKTKRQYSLLFILMIAIYMICAILYENLKQPIYIISVIPISFIGTFLIFSVFDLYFDQGGYAAFILLGGLTVNAAIFIINDLNASSSKFFNRNVIKAVLGKAFPILMTIISTIAGLIPFVIGGQDEVFWFSLAIGTIGGLVFSLLAIFVFLPVMLIKKDTDLGEGIRS